jgi:glycosyltransferase involved in cell wall biosynthesis
MRKVIVVYKTIPQYRGRFFEMVRERLAQLGVEFVLLYGQPSRKDALKKDTVDFPWAVKVSSRIWEIGNIEIYWQPVLGYLENADLVIVEQATKLLINYVLLVRNALGIQKLAFWGHGKNFHANSANGFTEWIKRLISTHVHWWFAYNDLSAATVQELGFPQERITSVQNAIDTRQLTNTLHALSSQKMEQVRRELGIHGANVAIYTSGMYPEKRIPFLLESLHLIRKQVPDFEMIFIGSGIDAGLIEQAASQYSWIHYVGPKFNNEKVPYFAISKLFLMPGLVGLGILDAFALETPLITTQIPLHSPEIGYLKNNINGIMLDDADNVQAYADTVAQLLLDEPRRQKLVEECRIAREYYTVEAMAENFVQGVLQALER